MMVGESTGRHHIKNTVIWEPNSSCCASPRSMVKESTHNAGDMEDMDLIPESGISPGGESRNLCPVFLPVHQGQRRSYSPRVHVSSTAN